MEKNEKIKYLEGIDITNREAKILYWFFKNHEGTSRDIEFSTFIRQPSVSLTLTKFQERKWISSADVYRGQRGRPHKYFKITNVEKVKSDIIKILKDKQANVDAFIEELQKW